MSTIHHLFFQVIAAEGEHKASRALRHAAEVIIDSPAALQVYRTILRPSPVVCYLTRISFGWMGIYGFDLE